MWVIKEGGLHRKSKLRETRSKLKSKRPFNAYTDRERERERKRVVTWHSLLIYPPHTSTF